METQTKQKLFQFLENAKPDMVALEKILTKEKSLAPENGGDGETKKANALIAWLTENGFKNIERYDAPDERVSAKVRPNIVATINGRTNDYCVWVMAHLDVVPEGKGWQTNPWEAIEKDGKIFGRGVEDNQQGLTSGVFASLAYVKNNITPKHTIKLLFMADEEVGSNFGIKYLLAHHSLFSKDDIIVIPDGGDANGETIEIAEKNILWLRIFVHGKQTHGSRPDTGSNACLAGNALSLSLHEMKNVFANRDELFTPPYSTFEPTLKKQNVDGINIIPGEDEFCMDCRILPCYSLAEVLAEVDTRIKKIENEYKVSIDYECAQKEESPATPKDANVVKKLSSALKEAHGIESRAIGIGGGTVAAALRNKGFNAAVWSSLCDMAHQPNEFCIIDNIVKDAKTLAILFDN